MTSRRIDLLLTAIRRQNEYDYKIINEKEKIENNIKNFFSKKNNKRKLNQIKIENNNNKRINKTLDLAYQSKDPLESIEYNSKPLIPIYKEDSYDYINKYKFNRKNVLNQNERNRMKTNKSMDLKLSIYMLNKKNYMDNIKNLFSQRNALNRKKTQAILEHMKISNDELRKNINMNHAKKYNNFINYMKKKNLEIKNYNDILNKKGLLAREKLDKNFEKNIKIIKTNINVNNNYFKPKLDRNIKSINLEEINKKVLFTKNQIQEKQEKIKEKIIEKENKYFSRAKEKEDKNNEQKNKSILEEKNNIKKNEIKLNEAKNIYNQIYKSEIIYKKEKL
jgi:hypothetical protein